MWLLFGLGNPGERYRNTWHNLGFMVVESLAAGSGGRWRGGPGDYLQAEVFLAGEKVVLIKPLTYMNHSGFAYTQACRYFRADPAETLVIFDDVALPLGNIRFRPAGSAGGHKGMAHILQQQGTEEIPRLRLGFAREAPVNNLREEVLNRIPTDWQQEVKDLVEKAAGAVTYYLENVMQEAMNKYNERGV